MGEVSQQLFLSQINFSRRQNQGISFMQGFDVFTTVNSKGYQQTLKMNVILRALSVKSKF